MIFRRTSTFNSSDSIFARVDGRLTITHGVKERCERVLLLLSRAPEGLSLEEISDRLERFGNGQSYSRSDIRYVIQRLSNEDLILFNRENQVYRASPNVLTAWERMAHDYL